MRADFIALAKTTPLLADALVYHLQQTINGSNLQDGHILRKSVGAQVEVCVSQTLYDWITLHNRLSQFSAS